MEVNMLFNEGSNEVVAVVIPRLHAELEVEVIERKLNKAKEKGTNPKQVVADLQRRLALEANDAEFFADYIENFLAGRVTTPFSEWRKGEKINGEQRKESGENEEIEERVKREGRERTESGECERRE